MGPLGSLRGQSSGLWPRSSRRSFMRRKSLSMSSNKRVFKSGNRIAVKNMLGSPMRGGIRL